MLDFYTYCGCVITDLLGTYLGLLGFRVDHLQRFVRRQTPRVAVRVHIGVHRCAGVGRAPGLPLPGATAPHCTAHRITRTHSTRTHTTLWQLHTNKFRSVCNRNNTIIYYYMYLHMYVVLHNIELSAREIINVHNIHTNARYSCVL